jgi:hypothetical protein
MNMCFQLPSVKAIDGLFGDGKQSDGKESFGRQFLLEIPNRKGAHTLADLDWCGFTLLLHHTTCMLRFFKSFSTSTRMARAPARPLIAVVGATGTGKSDVRTTS